jgi:hypothetical protein
MNITMRVTDPPVRVNDDIELDPDQWRIMLQHQQRFLGNSYRDQRLMAMAQDECRTFSVQHIQQGFVYIVTETMGDYPWIYVTEKTWKAVLGGVPFMMIGQQGTLAWLQQQGFQTFGSWWDESYDQLPTVAQRTQAVVRELDRLSRLDASKLVDLRRLMQPTLAHNLSNLQHLRQRELAKIAQRL